jgi:hypothetical protein
MTYKEQIKEYRNSGLSNREIAEEVGCDVRNVQLYLGPEINRLKQRQEYIKSRLPRVLIFDIETSPMLLFAWGLYKQQFSINQVKKPWAFLCWSAKWLNESEIFSACVTPKEAKARQDSRIVKPLWNLVEEADIIVAHNANRFDRRRFQARAKLAGLGPTTPFQVIDTLKVTQREFGFASHKLKYLNQILNIKEQKRHTEYEWWLDCVGESGPKQAKKRLKDMQDYCDQDIRALEDLYHEIAPWIKSVPNAGAYVETDQPICPSPGCGSLNLDYAGYYVTAVSKFRAFRCKDCGAIGRLRKNVLAKAVRNGLASPIAR